MRRQNRRLGSFASIVTMTGETAARRAAERNHDVLVIVDRHGPRNVVFQCPCGCGEILSINVDAGAGRAWKMRRDETSISLMPSVWRAGGCGSHFIVWRSRLWWCDSDDDPVGSTDWPHSMDQEFLEEWERLRSDDGRALHPRRN